MLLPDGSGGTLGALGSGVAACPDGAPYDGHPFAAGWLLAAFALGQLLAFGQLLALGQLLAFGQPLLGGAWDSTGGAGVAGTCGSTGGGVCG